MNKRKYKHLSALSDDLAKELEQIDTEYFDLPPALMFPVYSPAGVLVEFEVPAPGQPTRDEHRIEYEREVATTSNQYYGILDRLNKKPKTFWRFI